MGYIAHHAIVVSSSDSISLEKAHQKATSILLPVSGIVDGWINRERSFFVGPDGSKEAWAESDRADRLRSEFIAFMRSLAYDDGSSPLSWVEVRFSPDDRSASINNHSWKRKKRPQGSPDGETPQAKDIS